MDTPAGEISVGNGLPSRVSTVNYQVLEPIQLRAHPRPLVMTFWFPKLQTEHFVSYAERCAPENRNLPWRFACLRFFPEQAHFRLCPSRSWVKLQLAELVGDARGGSLWDTKGCKWDASIDLPAQKFFLVSTPAFAGHSLASMSGRKLPVADRQQHSCSREFDITPLPMSKYPSHHNHSAIEADRAG